MEMVDIEDSMLAAFGGAISWIFAPVGLGDWKGAVAVISAEMAKENAIGTLAVLNGVAADAEDMELMAGIAGMFTPIAAFSFMILNLFDPPCVVAMATIAREWATGNGQLLPSDSRSCSDTAWHSSLTTSEAGSSTAPLSALDKSLPSSSAWQLSG